MSLAEMSFSEDLCHFFSESRKTHQVYVKLQTLSSFNNPNFQSTCILCYKSDRYLKIARTFGTDRPVIKSSSLLGDDKLIAKLSEGDMHAIEVKCLCNFSSKLRTIKKQNKNYNENSITYGIVLPEIANFVKKTLKTSQGSPVFTLSDLRQMFSKAY